MPQAVKDILFETLKQLELSADSQASDPDVMKLRDDIAEVIFRLHGVKRSSASWEPKNPKVA